MITIIHGDNIVESRKALIQKIKQATANGLEVFKLDGTKVNLSEIRGTLESNSLFGANKLVIIENIYSSVKSTRKQTITDYLAEGNFDNDLIIWEPKAVKITNFPKVKDELYKITPTIFKFLDSIKPGNSLEMLNFLAEVKKQEEPEMIFFMICRHFRFLIIASDENGINKAGLPPWQMGKYKKQTNNFTVEILTEIYRQLEEIDYDQKTSGDAYSLSSRLDLLMASL